MNAGDLAEGTRALALPVRGVRRGTHGVAQDAGVLFETARLLLVMTRLLLQIARDHLVKMRSLRDNPRSPVVRAPALLFRARAPSVLARVDVEAARPSRVVAPLRIVMSVPLSEVGHFRAEVARAERTYPGALDVGARVRDEAESPLRAIAYSLVKPGAPHASNGRFLLRGARFLGHGFRPLSGTLSPTPDALRTQSAENRPRASG
jgi:hypothetical protein